jgi:hypothetical protein
LGEKALSPSVLSVGGRLGYVDDGTTPNTLIVFHDYKPAPLIFEVRGLPAKAGAKEMDVYRGAKVGVIVDLEGGSVLIPDYKQAVFFDKEGKRLFEPESKEAKRFSGSSSHFRNFLDAVRSRKHTDLAADILEGHLSSALCHTGNISYRLGKTHSTEQLRESIKANKDLAESFERMEQHLEANEVDLKKDRLTLGPLLQMDTKEERFKGNKQANQMLKRDYRKPFVVPENV